MSVPHLPSAESQGQPVRSLRHTQLSAPGRQAPWGSGPSPRASTALPPPATAPGRASVAPCTSGTQSQVCLSADSKLFLVQLLQPGVRGPKGHMASRRRTRVSFPTRAPPQHGTSLGLAQIHGTQQIPAVPTSRAQGEQLCPPRSRAAKGSSDSVTAGHPGSRKGTCDLSVVQGQEMLRVRPSWVSLG